MEEKNALAALAALSHETRLAVFRLLVTQGPTGLPAGEIADLLGVVASTLSFHLKELDRAGLLRSGGGSGRCSMPPTMRGRVSS